MTNIEEADGRSSLWLSTFLLPEWQPSELILGENSLRGSQSALIGVEDSPIESLDYEPVDNETFDESRRLRSEDRMYMVLKWSFALLIGLFTAIVGFLNNFSVENISGYKLMWTSSQMLKERFFAAFLLLAVWNLLLALSAACLCAYVAPAAAGSGIPEVKAYLNGIDSDSILAPSTLFVKIVGSICGVSSGLVLGKEGPMVHTGACIASFLGQGGSSRFGLTWIGFKYFKNDRDRRDLITCGAAAGVAAAFRAPVGGILFALEEAATWWRSTLLWRTFFTTAVVAVVLRNLINFCQKGKCGLFGGDGFIIFDVSKNDSTAYNWYDLLAILLIGALGGFLGALYNFLMDKILKFYKGYIYGKPSFKIFLTLFISLITSFCTYGLPWFFDCTPCPEGIGDKCPTSDTAGNYKKFNCPVGHYNEVATLFFNTNNGAIRNLFNGKTEDQFSQTTLLLHFVVIYILGFVTYGVAVPSGLFIPVILAGASYGRFIGNMMDSFSAMDHGVFALLGSAAFLGGTMRMTVSVCVIILELTNDLLMLPPIMLALLVSKTVGDCFNKGVYDQIVHMKSLPFMESHAEAFMNGMTVGDVIGNTIVSFSDVEQVENIYSKLQDSEDTYRDLYHPHHNGFPVINSDQKLVGLITRDHLVVLLNGKNFTTTRIRTGSNALLERFDPYDFGKVGSGIVTKIDDLDISVNYMDMYVDVNPIMNRSPSTVVESMSPSMIGMTVGDVIEGWIVSFSDVEKVRKIRSVLESTPYNAFPVIDSDRKLVGIITRHRLIMLLNWRNFTTTKIRTGSNELVERVDPYDFGDLDISVNYKDMYVDLNPIMNKSPYTVVKSMSLTKAKTMFRELGLRHVCVVAGNSSNSNSDVIVGMLTRHNFMEGFRVIHAPERTLSGEERIPPISSFFTGESSRREDHDDASESEGSGGLQIRSRSARRLNVDEITIV